MDTRKRFNRLFYSGQSGKLGDILDNLSRKINETEKSIKEHKKAAVLDHPDGSVTTSKLASFAVTESKIANGVVTEEKLAGDVQDILRTVEKIELSEAGYIAGLCVKIAFPTANDVKVSWYEGTTENTKTAVSKPDGPIVNLLEYHIGVGAEDADGETILAVSADETFHEFYAVKYLFSFDGSKYGTSYIKLTPEILTALAQIK